MIMKKLMNYIMNNGGIIVHYTTVKYNGNVLACGFYQQYHISL